MAITYDEHAEFQIARRGIDKAWIEMPSEKPEKPCVDLRRWSLGPPDGRLVCTVTRDSICMSDDVDAPHERWVTYHACAPLRDALQAIADRELPWTSHTSWRATSGSTILALLHQTSPDARGYTISHLADETAAFEATHLHFVYLGPPAR